MAKNRCSKCASVADTYPVNFDGCRDLCLDCRWQLVKLHNRVVDLNLSSNIKHMLFAKFFASRDGYSNLIRELELYGKKNTKE